MLDQVESKNGTDQSENKNMRLQENIDSLKTQKFMLVGENRGEQRGKFGFGLVWPTLLQ